MITMTFSELGAHCLLMNGSSGFHLELAAFWWMVVVGSQLPFGACCFVMNGSMGSTIALARAWSFIVWSSDLQIPTWFSVVSLIKSTFIYLNWVFTMGDINWWVQPQSRWIHSALTMGAIDLMSIHKHLYKQIS